MLSSFLKRGGKSWKEGKKEKRIKKVLTAHFTQHFIKNVEKCAISKTQCSFGHCGAYICTHIIEIIYFL
jgi:hypothetical protein